MSIITSAEMNDDIVGYYLDENGVRWSINNTGVMHWENITTANHTYPGGLMRMPDDTKKKYKQCSYCSRIRGLEKNECAGCGAVECEIIRA